MVLLDSNLIVYSLNDISDKQLESQEFIKNNRSNLCLSHQNILESIRVLTHSAFERPMNSQSANRAVWTIAGSLILISPNLETIFLVRQLIDKHSLKADKIFDAYLVATAITNGVFSIATDNAGDFRKFEGISVVNPFLVK